jgi:hypothetical protein
VNGACCESVELSGICGCGSEARWARFQDRVNRLMFARHLYRTGRLTEWPDGPPAPRPSSLGTWCSVALVVGAFVVMFAYGGR